MKNCKNEAFRLFLKGFVDYSIHESFYNFRRLFTAMAGWKAGPFAAFDYFFWIPWLVPHFGGIVGAVIYELMVELHHPEPEETNEFYITK